MADRPKVVYWFKQPTPYAVARFNAIMDRRSMDFEAWFSEERESDRSWAVDRSTWRFPSRYLPVTNMFGLRMRIPLAELRAARPDVFILEYDRINLALGVIAARYLATRVVLRCLPNYDAWSKRTWWRETAKHLMFRIVDAAKVPGTDGMKLAVRYGLPAERTWRVRQGIDLAHYASARVIPAEVRQSRRASLKLTGCVFLYVGRLWRGKGLDELFDAFRRLKQDRLDASLLILGDGIDERRYRELGRGIADVVFGGFVQPDELPKWYALADCLVFPTHGDPNGLVVEEAFASGLPVIVTRSAGDIEERVGQAGMVVETGSPDALRRAMARVVLDPSLLQTMTRRTWRVAEDKDVGRYAEDFEVLIREVSEAPARTGMLVWLTKLLGRALSGISRLGQLPLNREAGCGYAPDLEGSRRPRSDPRSAGVEGGVGGRQALRRP